MLPASVTLTFLSAILVQNSAAPFDTTLPSQVECVPFCPLEGKDSKVRDVLSQKPNCENNGATVDWREKHIVTEVEDEKECESGWAFAVTSSLESAIAKKTGKLESLSAQELIDCSHPLSGCGGGSILRTFMWIASNDGLSRKLDYNYTGKQERCRKGMEHIAKIKGIVQLGEGKEDQLKGAIDQIGPVATSIQVIPSLREYKSGVYQDINCGNKTTHGVTVIGYGSEDGNDYWIVKNSWGKEWGSDGYGKIARNRPFGGMCGIAMHAFYPILAD